MPDGLLVPYVQLEVLQVRMAIAVYTISLLANGISVRREAELAFFFIAVSVVSILTWVILAVRRARTAQEELPGVSGQVLFWAVAIRSLLPPQREDSREVFVFGVFAVCLLGYMGLQAALAFGL